MSEILDLAKSTYNQAFKLLESDDDSQRLEGLEIAATSLHLWRQVGTDTNVSIGLWLYSKALGLVGANEASITAAKQSLELAETNGTDWLIASAHEGLARASKGTEEFENHKTAAKLAIAKISDPEDRALIESQIADLG